MYKASCHISKQLSSHKVSVPMTNLVNHTDVKISKFHHQRIAEATYLTEVRWRMASRTHEVSD
jgi:hypothetical protein